MLYLLITLLALALCYLLIRQWRVRRYLRELEDAVRRRSPYLFSHGSSGWLQANGLAGLVSETNKLLNEGERSHRQGQSYLHQIEITLSKLTESVLIIDTRYQLVMANAAARRLLGLPAHCEGKRLEQFIPSAKFLEYLESAETGATPPWREIDLKRENGRQLFLEVTSARIPHSERAGDRPLTLIVLHDITRLKELENVRREFVANVSHELRTPVTIIKGYSDALIEDHDKLPKEELLRFLCKIHRNVNRLHLLLEDLLTLSRLEGGSVDINLKPTQLHKLIAEQIENLTPRLGPSQSISCELSPDIDQINIDAIKLTQVIRNILDNVLRYAKGFTTIRIRTQLQSDTVILTIEDDGCGIPQKDLSHIFERFYTVDKGRSRELGGTGLGLSIAKHIIQLHKGQIKAENVKPHGLKIECHLPLI